MKRIPVIAILLAAIFACTPVQKPVQKPEFYYEMGDQTVFDGVSCVIDDAVENGVKVWNITMANASDRVFAPVKAGIRLGIDTYMDKYPEWLCKYFPTLLYCSKTHFHGYFQTPGGKVLGIASPDPVASWSVDYNMGYEEPEGYWFYGHRITSVNLDLINALPLPEHHPQDMWKLEPGESMKWKILLAEMDDISDYESRIHDIADIPMIKMSQTSYSAGQQADFEVFADDPRVEIMYDGLKSVKVECTKAGDCWKVSCKLDNPGLYKIELTSGRFTTEGYISAHKSWEWTMRRAREAVKEHRQRATSHVESWYGYHTAFLAAKHFPEPSLDSELVQRFDMQMDLLYGPLKSEPLHYEWRIQNVSSTIGMYVDKYEAYGNLDDLKIACRLADWLAVHAQWKDGAYRNKWETVYTSVIYMGKSMLELYEAELAVAQRFDGKEEGQIWRDAAARHYDSAKRAIDQLVRADGDFHTEGEMTFEDGMVSCSALQMGALALLQLDEAARKHYTDAMLRQLESHSCLTQLKIPDARRRGGTMRYWESQYDVHIMPNMFSSPHGWSAWRAYATYYAYLLTGQERWLLETWNAMGAFANLIDYKSGELRWAFVVDPYVRARQISEPVQGIDPGGLDFGNPHPDMYKCREFVLGEQYVPMISSWQTRNSQDNDVHEVFKFLAEAFLTNAFIIERDNGEIVGYNCKVVKMGRCLHVIPDESQIVHLHSNMKGRHILCWNGKEITVDEGCCWID